MDEFEEKTVFGDGETEKPEETAAEKPEDSVPEAAVPAPKADSAEESTPAAQPARKYKSSGWIAGISAALIVLMLGFGYMLVSGMLSGKLGIQEISHAEISGEASGGKTESDFSGVEISDRPQGKEYKPQADALSTSEVVEKVSPSVVTIYNYTKVMSGGNVVDRLASSGSGVIMTENGYIVTNAHVVDDAAKLEVILSDGTVYKAKTVGADTKSDIAVIKVEAEGLSAAEFGSSDQVKVGEFVMVMGSPGVTEPDEALDNIGSVSFGVISATHRKVIVENKELTCIQTDAAINPGNSGGALVNMFGQVIGIPSAKIQAVEYEGVGFAIEINKVQNIINDIVKNGRVTSRAMLGITGSAISKELAEAYNLEPGVMIVSIGKDSDMVYHGILVNDIITHLDGKAVSSVDDISKILENFKPGDKITVSVFRRVAGDDPVRFDAEITLTDNAD